MANFLIIAASSDIGQATAELLHHNNHRLFLTSRSNEGIKSLASNLQAPFALLDATSFEAVDQVVERAMNELGSLDGIVNCAGSLFLKAAHLTNFQQYQDVINASLTTSFATIKAASKHMLPTGGSVVLISSAAAITGFSNHEAIAAAKAGIIWSCPY